MRTGLIEWEHVPPDDLQVSEVIARAGNSLAGDGKGDICGIRNGDGSIYRVIACDDDGESQRIAIALQGLGFFRDVARGVNVDRGFQHVFDREPKRAPVPSFRPGGHRSRR